MNNCHTDKTTPQLTQCPDILGEFARELGKLGLTGEDRAAKLLYLALTSRVLETPVNVAVKGPSSGGKSHLVEKVLQFFPSQAFYALSAMSERALIYSPEPLVHRHLVLFEAAGLTGDFATYAVRTLLSEGRLCYEVTEKNSSGSLVARRIERRGPTGLILTTTLVRWHPENETRMLNVTIDDSPEQTRRVLRSLAAVKPEKRDLTLWVELQEWIAAGEHRVVIPYAETLAETIPTTAVRMRRDFGKVLALIRAHAILHQAIREKTNQGEIVATLDDYGAVRSLVVDSLGEGSGLTVSRTTRETVEAVRKLLNAGSENGAVSLADLAPPLGRDKSSVSRRVAVAIKGEYLVNQETRRGQPMKLVLGAELPEDQEVLPSVAVLQGELSVAVANTQSEAKIAGVAVLQSEKGIEEEAA
jgi:hypothetical protein